MLQSHHRLSARIRLQSPITIKSSTFILKAAKNNTPESKFGFIVRKALDKRATQRNRYRRVFRSCIEQMLDQITPGYDMLFILQKAGMEVERDNLYEEIETVLKKHSLLQ